MIRHHKLHAALDDASAMTSLLQQHVRWLNNVVQIHLQSERSLRICLKISLSLQMEFRRSLFLIVD